MIVHEESIGSGRAVAVLAERDTFSPGAVAEVPVGALSVADTPRVNGENPEHVQALAAAHEELPPILVHRSTMRVIDGVHRLRVAELRGDHNIAARFFSGNEKDAFVLAVKSNITHGLPLSLADRKAAAGRIIVSHPQWSDRMIASVVGLAAKTVAEIRKLSADEAVRPERRIGRDGRVRPISAVGGRLLAAKLIDDNPGLSLRQIARAAGVSPETARDVRYRLQRGEDPVPGGNAARGTQSAGKRQRRAEQSPAASLGLDSRQSRAAVIERLTADPALRFTETGRMLLRLLHLHIIKTEEWQNIGEHIPPHCGGIVADLARDCAQMWQELADQVERNLVDTA